MDGIAWIACSTGRYTQGDIGGHALGGDRPCQRSLRVRLVSTPAHVVAWWRAVQFEKTLVLRVRVIRRYAQRCSVLVSLVIEGLQLYAHLRAGPAGLAAVFSERLKSFQG